MTMTTKTKPQVLSASTLIGDDVYNPQGENLGSIKELMLDVDLGRVAYAVLSFGGILGMGDKLFAIPFQSLRLNAEKEHFMLDVSKERMKEAPGFDKDDWPTATDRAWGREIHSFYEVEPYWESKTRV